MKTLIFTLLTLISAPTFAVIADCVQIEVSKIKTVSELAYEMGKERVFQIELMTAYEDDKVFAPGELVKVSRKDYKAEFILAKKHENKFEYTLSSGHSFFMAVNRELASVRVYKACK